MYLLDTNPAFRKFMTGTTQKTVKQMSDKDVVSHVLTAYAAVAAAKQEKQDANLNNAKKN